MIRFPELFLAVVVHKKDLFFQTYLSFCILSITFTVIMMFRWSLCAGLLALAAAYQPSASNRKTTVVIPKKSSTQSTVQTHAATAVATAALSALLSAAPALATPAAAQISLNQIPPTSISVEIGDLPVVGNLLSGTYTKVADGTFKGTPSITIKSPSDKIKAIQSIATGGHLEFDVNGKLKTHLDVDVAADEPGVARIRVASDLIPPLPFKNLASSRSTATGGKESAWNVVTNLGNGGTSVVVGGCSSSAFAIIMRSARSFVWVTQTHLFVSSFLCC